MRRAREMAIALLRRESSGDAPGGAPPSRLWTLPTHVVDQHPRCKHPHQPHWPRSRVFHRNRDRGDVIVRVSVPNTGIRCPSRYMEGELAQDRLPYYSFQTGALADSPEVEPDCPTWNHLLQMGALADAEPQSPAAPPLPISTNDPSREHTGSTT
jgi:hypothetical protein